MVIRLKFTFILYVHGIREQTGKQGKLETMNKEVRVPCQFLMSEENKTAANCHSMCLNI